MVSYKKKKTSKTIFIDLFEMNYDNVSKIECSLSEGGAVIGFEFLMGIDFGVLQCLKYEILRV